ncbi:D-alanyl-D-alanine carboxypeptidase DacF precursor [Pelagimonas phthalicica]|uniref:D-alanyl-D-alanine carboxypeptidase DacF n=1 Tax=Pelagimonas phthalicica TaxID=1037362 RepID=A0A238JHR1_9RHOB|nr:D-alanyl-D-alanine carboxypeptidase family protein [Pelagimonas phthalicica]TDS89765.1 D-alanyl-D-alanine carboxypeptidase [Pelagimonas phthalicica]SMX29933.1 D-alanyl-D-alanine carboxypeptidase DacF precursor [Pelagimonas phthalicica]
MGLYLFTFIWLALLVPLSAMAAPYAAMVMDARSGKVLHARNADTRLHPASLTKMMTLYIAFEAVQNGEISMDTLVKVSAHAASEPPSKLGLRAGQKIKLRYLVRAAAVKSANDAATAIGEAIEGSEAAFARRMNRTAKALGMTRTSFRNAHGLTENGHLSTARDMTILGRHVIYDYPMYYNLWSRKTADAGIKTVAHTNRRLLSSYRGADGIKTGYTRAAGFNLVASAERGRERVIATVFGGRSTASRNAKVAELLDLGFKRAPTRVAFRSPRKPPYRGSAKGRTVIAEAPAAPKPAAKPGQRAKSVRVASAAVTRSLRPQARPLQADPVPDTAPLVASVQDDIEKVLKEVQTVAAVAPSANGAAPAASVKPVIRPARVVAAAPRDVPTPSRKAEVITRLSTSGGRHWGINVGRYPSRFTAEKVLLKTALAETSTLDGSLRKVVKGKRGFDANFMGLTRDTAELACKRLQARQVTCFMIGPS